MTNIFAILAIVLKSDLININIVIDIFKKCRCIDKGSLRDEKSEKFKTVFDRKYLYLEFVFQPLCKEERKDIEEEEMGGSNNDNQQTENGHNGSNGNNGRNGSNGINGKEKEQTEKRHSWRLEMFEDQKVVLFVKHKKPFTFKSKLGKTFICQNQTLRRSDRLSNTGGWRARQAPTSSLAPPSSS